MVQQRPAQVGPGSTRGRGVRLGGGLIATLVGVGLLAVFMAQNRQEVTLSLLFWDFRWPLWLLTLVAAALGAVVWFGLGVLRRRRRRSARRAARNG